MTPDDPRVAVPICTVARAAQLAGMPYSTLASWTKPTSTRPALVHHTRSQTRGWPTIPLVGLVEAASMRALRVDGMPMKELVAAVVRTRELGGPYAVASPRLFHDGVVAYEEQGGGYFEVRSTQGVFKDIVQPALRPFKLAPDGYAEAFVFRELPGVPDLPGVEIDPRFSSGRPRFTRTGIPLYVIAGGLQAGDPVELVAATYGLTRREVNLVNQHLYWLADAA